MFIKICIKRGTEEKGEQSKKLIENYDIHIDPEKTRLRVLNCAQEKAQKEVKDEK